jgi:hypothetical protein
MRKNLFTVTVSAIALVSIALIEGYAQTPASKPCGPTAMEVFHLTTECGRLAKQVNEEHDESFRELSLAGGKVPTLSQDYESHYDARTNRCYVEITVTPDAAVFAAKGLFEAAGPNSRELKRYTKAAEEVDQMVSDGWMNRLLFDGQTGKQLIGALALGKNKKPICLMNIDGKYYDPQSFATYSIAISKIEELMGR